MTEQTRPDGRRAKGRRSRELVLERAVELASAQGLDGLSLGELAAALGISKSGLFAHWREKQALQLDTVEWARRQWIEHIVAPALQEPRGVRRVFALHEARLRFYSEGVLPGGCFFLAAQAEFDDRPGPVRSRVAEAMREWEALLRRLVQEAVELGELSADTDPAQLAYEIDALGGMVVTRSRLLREQDSTGRARRAVLHRLRALSPRPSLLPEE